jgi:hypothetical protein
MQKFFIKIAVFMLLFFLTDRVAGKAMQAWSQLLTPDQRIGKLLNGKIQNELIVLGSSRAAHNLVASEVEARIGISAYNLGFAGSDIDFHTQILDLLLSGGHVPRYLLLAVDASEIKEDPSINFRYDLLYPHAGDERISKILVARGQLNNHLFRMFHTYREKLGFIEVFRPYALFRKPVHETRPDGSIPLVGHSASYEKMKFKDGNVTYSTTNESPQLRERFAELVSLCTKNKIQLVLIVSPNFTRPIVGLAERMQYLGGEGVITLDYSARPEFLRKELFSDIAHLNSQGAALLSQRIGEDLRKVETINAKE